MIVFACSPADQIARPLSPEESSLQAQRPTLPATLNVFDREIAPSDLENPLWTLIAAQLISNPDQARQTHVEAVLRGRDVYYTQCVHCHGDLLDGNGLIGLGQDPPPTDFVDGPLLGEVSEAYLFWRIARGGPGLPREFAPWRSAMPAFEDEITESETWDVITFLYDSVNMLPDSRQQLVRSAIAGAGATVPSIGRASDPVDLYETRCAVCHGQTGEGDGPAAEFLYPKPRNFTLGLFKYNNSPFKELRPTDENLFRVIASGLPRTAMPAWGSVLSEAEIQDLINVVKAFDWVGTWAPKDAPDSDFDDEGLYIGPQVSITDEISVAQTLPITETSLEIGREEFLKSCSPCHGNEGRGSPSAEKRLRDEWGARIWPRDLTKPWTWRVTNVDGNAEETIANIFTRLSVGIPGTPMPAHEGGVSLENRWHIAHYVYTLRDTTPQLSGSPVIRALRTVDQLPTTVNDPTWASVEVTTLVMIPNLYSDPRLYTPLNDSISVRAIYNADNIAFLLEMDDRTFSRPGDPDAERIRDSALELHPDAFGIQFPHVDAYSLEPELDLPLFQHGDASHPITMWYWHAESIDPEIPAQISVLDGNGMNEPLIERAGDPEVQASGEWINGRWRILINRARIPTNPVDVSFDDGVTIPISFSQWDGSNGETGNRHLLSQWYWLSIGTNNQSFLEWDSNDKS